MDLKISYDIFKLARGISIREDSIKKKTKHSSTLRDLFAFNTKKFSLIFSDHLNGKIQMCFL